MEKQKKALQRWIDWEKVSDFLWIREHQIKAFFWICIWLFVLATISLIAVQVNSFIVSQLIRTPSERVAQYKEYYTECIEAGIEKSTCEDMALGYVGLKGDD